MTPNSPLTSIKIKSTGAMATLCLQPQPPPSPGGSNDPNFRKMKIFTKKILNLIDIYFVGSQIILELKSDDTKDGQWISVLLSQIVFQFKLIGETGPSSTWQATLFVVLRLMVSIDSALLHFFDLKSAFIASLRHWPRDAAHYLSVGSLCSPND